MEYDLVLRSGTILTPSGKILADIGIADGKIKLIGTIDSRGKKQMDCSGLFILTGAIDMHVHFREPGYTQKEDFESGGRAALAGGVTTVADMPNTDPPTTTVQRLGEKYALARKKAHCNILLYIGFTGDNFDEIRGAKDAIGVKLYMAQSQYTKGSVEGIEKLLQLGKLIVVHAEDEEIIQQHMATFSHEHDPSIHSLIRPPVAAFEAVRKILHLAKKYNARVHITHVSTKLELAEIAKFKSSGRVTCDVTPHHLFLNETAYATLGCFAKVNPPLRHESDRKYIWEALRSGLVDCIATDHAPHTKKEKQQDYWDAPAGMPGVETLLPLILDAVNHGELSLEDVVRLTSQKPSEILHLKTKGEISEGFDADLTIVDMNLEKSVGQKGYQTKCGWSPFDGRKLKGWPVATFVAGRQVFG